MEKISMFKFVMPFLGFAIMAQAQPTRDTLVVTASNATQNQLLVYDSSGSLVQIVPTHGQGGASGNAGGIEAQGDLIAVVNFGSKTVSLLERQRHHFSLVQSVPTRSNPVSVAFGHDHLYVLGTTTIESHQMYRSRVSPSADGVTTLLHADGTSAQVGVLPRQLIVTEKSNMIETVDLVEGAVASVPTAVENIPANVNAPFGLVTRGDDAYVTIAHANEISLVRNGAVLTVTSSDTQSAPCWVALMGPFLFSSNTGSMTISRYAVYGQKIVQDAAVVAQQNGGTADIAAAEGLVAVIDGSGQVSHLSIYQVDEDGNFSLVKASTINSAANGVALVPEHTDRFEDQ